MVNCFSSVWIFLMWPFRLDRCEKHLTIRTMLGFLFGVSPCMLFKITMYSKGFQTSLALQCFLLHVSADMFPQVRSRWKIFDNNFTGRVSLWCESWCVCLGLTGLKNISDNNHTGKVSLWCESWCDYWGATSVKNIFDNTHIGTVSL